MLSKKSVLALLVGGAGLTVTSLAFGHGAMIDPPTRGVACKLNQETGVGICKTASDSSNTAGAFSDWQGNTDFVDAPHTAELAKATIPGNKICSGRTQATGFNMASPEWKTTVIKPDAHGKVNMRYGFTAPHHKSWTEFYISKKGFDPTTQVLTWDDVELLDIQENIKGEFLPPITNPLLFQLIKYQDFQVEIPADRTGRAVIFSRWQREDTGREGFYGCSDVQITARGSDNLPPVELPDDGGNEPAPIDWVEYSKFADTQNPSAGQTVVFRVIGGAKGADLITIRKPITTSNAGDKWISELATEINRDHSNMVLIGQKSQSGSIAFNPSQLRANGIFFNNTSYSALLTVEQANNTPNAIVGGNFEVVSPANGQATYKLDGSNSDNAVSYSWKVVGGEGTFWLQDRDGGELTSTINKAVVNAVIPANTKGSAIYELTVTSSNGKTDAKRLTITVKDNNVSEPTEPTEPTDPSGDEWKTGVNYKLGEVVEYQGKKYRCRQPHPSMAHWNPADVLALWEPVN